MLTIDQIEIHKEHKANRAYQANDVDNAGIAALLADSEHAAEIAAILATDPEYAASVRYETNGDDALAAAESTAGYELEAMSDGFLKGLYQGVPYCAVNRTPEQWTRYLARSEKTRARFGIEFAFTKAGKARTQTKRRAKRRVSKAQEQAIRAKLAK
jgi:hypothetical protein